MQKIKIDNKIIEIFYNKKTSPNIPVIILNTFEKEGKNVWKELQNISDKECILVAISNIDWGKDMTPWKIKENEKYLGKADNYIEQLENTIIPKITETINNDINVQIDYFAIVGYSMAGLFALYMLYKSSKFVKMASISGSLWYPNIINYIEKNELKVKPEKMYFSLGNMESKTRNLLFSKVENNTKYVENYYKNLEINTIFEENKGNHFQDSDKRTAKAIKCLLE